MENSRSKKAVAASLSLALALGSVPAVALADDADQDGKDVAAQEATPASDITVNIQAIGLDGATFGDRGTSWSANYKAGENTVAGICQNFVQDYDGLELASGDPFGGNGFHSDDVVNSSCTLYIYYQPKQKEETPASQVKVKVTSIGINGADFGDRNTEFEGTFASGATVGEICRTFVQDYDGLELADNPFDFNGIHAADKVISDCELHIYYQPKQQTPASQINVKVKSIGVNGADFGDRNTEFEGTFASGATVGEICRTFVQDYDGLELAENPFDFNGIHADDAVTEDTTLYIYYQPKQQVDPAPASQINVKVKSIGINGADFGDRNTEWTGTFASGTTVADICNTFVQDYDGLELAENPFDFNGIHADDAVTEDTTLYIYYQPKQAEETHQYVVNYDFNDGTEPRSATFDVTDSQMEQGFTGWLNVVQPQRDGYEFLGWAYKDGDGTILSADTPMPNTDTVDVVAQWKAADAQAEQITVKFVDNFNETESSTEVKKGEAVAKPADPTYDGWTFEGWSSTLKDDEGNWKYTPVDFSMAVEDEDQDGVVTYYAFYSENQAAADDTANGEEATVQEAAGDDADAADESSIAPQTGDATNVATVAGIGGIAGLLAAAAALLRRRHNN